MRARRKCWDRDEAERTYDQCGGETKMDKEGGMKGRKTRGNDVHDDNDDDVGGENWQKQRKTATRRGGSMLRLSFVVQPQIHTHTHDTVSMPRDGIAKTGSEESDQVGKLQERAREEDSSLRMERKQQELPATVAYAGVKPRMCVGRTREKREKERERGERGGRG